MKTKKKDRSCARFVIYVFPLMTETPLEDALYDLVGEIVLPSGERAKFNGPEDLEAFMNKRFRVETLMHRIKVQGGKLK